MKKQKRIVPHVDLYTEDIFGCNKGSWMWWHEKGHLIYHKNPTTSQIKLIQEFIFVFWMFSITLSILNPYMLVISLPCLLSYIGIDVYEEWWCDRYADVMFKTQNTGFAQ